MEYLEQLNQLSFVIKPMRGIRMSSFNILIKIFFTITLLTTMSCRVKGEDELDKKAPKPSKTAAINPPASNRTKTTKTAVNKPRVKALWQEKFVKTLQKNKDYISGWGLFSYGGWADNGQILVFSKKDGTGVIQYANPGSKSVDKTTTMSKAELDAFHKKTTHFSGMKDLNQEVYDGLQYEYVVAVKENNKVKVTERVFMNNPGVAKKESSHTDIINSFAPMKPKIKK